MPDNIDYGSYVQRVLDARNNKTFGSNQIADIQKDFANTASNQGLPLEDIQWFNDYLKNVFHTSSTNSVNNTNTSNSIQNTNAAQAISRTLGIRNAPSQPTAQPDASVPTDTTIDKSSNFGFGGVSAFPEYSPFHPSNILNNAANEAQARRNQYEEHARSYQTNGVDTLVQEDLRPNKNRLLDSDRYAEMHNNMRDAVVNARSILDTMLPPNMDYQTLTVLRAPASDSNKVVDFIVNKLGFKSDDADAKANLRENINNYRNKWNSITKNPDEKMSFNDAALAVLTSANSSNFGRTVYGEANMPTFNADDFKNFMDIKKNNLNLLKQYDSLKRLAKDYINSYTNLRSRQSDIISTLNRIGHDKATNDPIIRKQFDLMQKELEYQYGLYNKYGTKLNQFMNNFYNKAPQQ